jgi:hypothetical protein
MPIVRLKMSSKLISSLMVIFFIATPYMSSAHDIPKPSFSLGTMLISDNAFNALAGTGVTIDDSDIVANFIVDYHVSPSLAFEGGVITSPEVSAYSASGALTLKAKTDTSYFFGVKYSPSSTGALDFYGKAGLLFWDVDFSVSGSGTLTYNGSTYNSKTFLQVDGSDPFIGLGLSYEISKNTSFALDYITSASTNAIEGVAFDLSGYSISWLRSF